MGPTNSIGMPPQSPMPIQSFNQRRSGGVWLIAFIITLVLFLTAAGFGFWAYSGRQKYKNDVEPMIASAVAAAQKTTSDKKDAEFVEKEKQPLRTYNGPSAYGSLNISYPKTWSAYVDESGHGSAPLDGSFNPGFVPGLQSGNNVALHVQVVSTQYASVIQSFDSQIKSGKIQASPYTLPKVNGTVGQRFDGEVVPQKQGAMVILPIRDKTLKIWTEASQYVGDFNTIILPNLTFSP